MVGDPQAYGGGALPGWLEPVLRCPEGGAPLRDGVLSLLPEATGIEDEYWARRAQGWGRVGEPWRPGPSALQATRRLAGPMAGLTALQLGVTPEVSALPRQAGARLVAVDRSARMIRALWRPDPSSVALCADWRSLPLADGSVDLVLGDGVVAVLPPADLGAVTRQLHRVSRPRAAFVTRVFTRPDEPEPVSEVLAALRAGDCASVEAFRMRLVGALHGDQDHVVVHEVWRAFHQGVSDPAGLALALGWPADAFEIFEAGRGASATLRLPTPRQLESLLLPHFVLEEQQLSDPEPPGRCRALRYRRG